MIPLEFLLNCEIDSAISEYYYPRTNIVSYGIFLASTLMQFLFL